MFNQNLRFDADKGGAGTGGADNSTNTATPPVNGGEPPANGGGSGDGEKLYTQADVNRFVQDRLAREKKLAEERTVEERRKAEADALAKNAEWQKLAESRDVELKTMQAKLRDAEVRAAAAQLGIEDVEYAAFLVARAGEGADPEAVLKEYAEKHKTDGAKAGGGTQGSGSSTNPNTQKGVFTRAQLRDPAFFQANRDAIMLALRENRIRDE